ncbi:MAG TPA: RsmE family RNA methyltransferase [Lacunisphaera sp.]|nr:RsmE family RNA methyltransferase [Lacunisphaera sp.]
MNIILFSPGEVELPLPRRDPRSRHILEVLRRGPGGSFDAGLINGPRGKATLQAVTGEGLRLTFEWGASPPPLAPLRLIVGLPRPQTARDLLREGASLGVAAMDFVATERGEPSYGRSSLWTSREWEKLLVAGAAQAFCTRLPRVQHGRSLAEALSALPAGGVRIALDNYGAPVSLRELDCSGETATLALGAERGWSGGERALLLQRGFLAAHLGERVLRAETACIAAVTLLKAKLGWA